MPTNILSIPQVAMSVVTGNNEDWIDSLKYNVAYGEEPFPQLDLRGITFTMEVRREADDHEVVISGSTNDGSLSIGLAPDYGYLIINISREAMKMIPARDYVGDVVAQGDGITRVVIQITLTVFEGVTKWP